MNYTFIEDNKVTGEATATADATTTSSTDVLMTGMTITPVAGTYLVLFSTTIDHSNQNVATVCSLYVGGVQDTDTVRGPISRTNAIGAITTFPVVAINALATVDGTQAIEIRWKTASGTATVHQRTFNVVQI